MIHQLLPLLLLAIAFLPRLVALGRYVTPDEAIWVYRSIRFREALLDGRWADTLVAGHPGVTTTWLGAIGMTVQMWLSSGAREAYDWLVTMATLTPDNVAAFQRLTVLLTGGRVAVVLVNSVGIVGIFFLVRRIWGWPAAVAGGILLTFDPFLLGLSGLLHVDGLSATFVTLSLLALLLGLGPDVTGRGSRLWLAAAGALAGLAALTKTPTLLLLPVSGLAMLWPFVRDRRLSASVAMATFFRNCLAWGLAFSLIILALYPALWTSPAAVMATVGGNANRHLAEALRETYFLGQAAFDHGVLFYPVVLLWRLSPVIWLALVPAVWLLVRGNRVSRWQSPARLSALLLLVWAITFLIAITPAAKKFDRYILPVVPALLLLAAVVWTRWAARAPRTGRWALPLILMLQFIFWLAYAAYPLTAYNPLVGGPRTAVAVLPIGWGEGISAAGGWLTQSQPDVTQRRAMSGIVPSLAPFYSGVTLVDGLDDPATADFSIVTLGGRQLAPVGFQAQIAGLELLHTEHFGGLDQAWIYLNPAPSIPAAPPPLDDPVIFGEQLALTAVGQMLEDDSVRLGARWRRLAALPADGRYALRIVIKDDAGNIWATQETDLLNEVYFYPPDWETDDTGDVRYSLELPPGIPPALYQIVLSVIDNQTAGQLPVRAGGEGFQGVEYEVGEIVVPAPATIVSASRIQIPKMGGETWLGNLQLLGQSEIAAEALAGSRLPVDLFWHLPSGTLPEGLLVSWHLISTDDGSERIIQTEPLSRYDTGKWRTGETIQEKYRVPLPPNLQSGDYRLAVEPLLAGEGRVGSPFTLGTLRINNIDRQYAMPDDIPVKLDVSWEPLALAGFSPADLASEPGLTPELTLYWTNQATHGEVYTVFLHVVNSDGEIVLYADHWPGGLPTDILDRDQVVVDRVALPLPSDLPPGTYNIRLGLYQSETGERLPVIAAGDEMSSFVGGDSITLPTPLQVTAP